jgi:hypothetical protein
LAVAARFKEILIDRDSLRNARYSSIAMEDRIPAFESVDDVMVGVYRAMKPEKRLEIALGMWLSARQMLYVDSIVSKLEFYREGRSDKHLRDIAGIIKISGEEPDLGHIASVTQGKGLRELWEELLEGTRE